MADPGLGLVVVCHVPAQVRGQCGEDWIEDEVAEGLEAMVEKAGKSHAIVELAGWKKNRSVRCPPEWLPIATAECCRP